MDPCQTFDQKIYAIKRFEDIEKHQSKSEKIAEIKQGSEMEGVLREEMYNIPIPRPQVYHTYCQICNCQYDNFDEHIATDSHLRRAKNQAQIGGIDDLISQLNTE